MIRDIKRTIRRIIDLDTAEFLDVSDIFQSLSNKDDYLLLRKEVSKRNRDNDPQYLCEICGTRLSLSCYPDQKGDHSYFFRHQKDPGESICPIRTNSGISREEILKRQYELKKESKPHIQLKSWISDVVRRFIDPDVVTDSKFIFDKDSPKEKRKPDINFSVGEKKYVIEIQLNNTFQEVIAEREEFYAKNEISLLWVFHKFDPHTFNSIAAKDIYVPNYNNAFVFDKEMYETSLANGTLQFHVHFKDYSLVGENIIEEWKDDTASHLDLQIDANTKRTYFYDGPSKRRLVESQQAELRASREKELNRQTSYQVLNEVKNFIKEFKKNDLLPYRSFQNKIRSLDSDGVKLLNNELDLKSKKDQNNRNVIQCLAWTKKHDQLLRFFLETKEIELDLQSDLPEETTLISILSAREDDPFDAIAAIAVTALFNRGYRLTEQDAQYISSKDGPIDAKRKQLFLKYLECCKSPEMFETILRYLKELFVFESAKAGKLVVLGNELQSILWLANLAADQYKSHWHYFHVAFEHYGFMPKIWSEDKKETFRNHFDRANQQGPVRCIAFENVVIAIFPELADPIESVFGQR